MTTIIIFLLGIGVLSKLLKLIKDIALTVLSVVGSLISILVLFRLLYKWILKPSLKAMKYIAKKIWLFMRWIGDKMIEHFTYRNNNQYWALVANSMDRNSIR